MHTMEFTANGNVKLSVDKLSRVKIVNDALKTGGITATVTVNKIVDLNAAPKPKTPAQIAALEKRRKAAADKKKKGGK